MVTAHIHVDDNGDLELPPRPRRRIHLRGRINRRRDHLMVAVPTDLRLSTLIA